MSNLIGPAYDAICPKCGTNKMGNAAGLGECNTCHMLPQALAKTSVAFLDGFKPVCTEFVRGAMMKPYRVRAFYDPVDKKLVAMREYSWSGGNDREDVRSEDGEEFTDAENPAEQQRFLKALADLLVNYYRELGICCLRRDTSDFPYNDVGIYPLERKTH